MEYDIKLRLGFTADQDFIYMCNANYFVPSGGGYTNIIKQMVAMNGNKVIGYPDLIKENVINGKWWGPSAPTQHNQ